MHLICKHQLNSLFCFSFSNVCLISQPKRRCRVKCYTMWHAVDLIYIYIFIHFASYQWIWTVGLTFISHSFICIYLKWGAPFQLENRHSSSCTQTVILFISGCMCETVTSFLFFFSSLHLLSHRPHKYIYTNTFCIEQRRQFA